MTVRTDRDKFRVEFTAPPAMKVKKVMKAVKKAMKAVAAVKKTMRAPPADPAPKDLVNVCEVCSRVWPRERIPFAFCNFCHASPSWHHGRCCQWWWAPPGRSRR